MAAKRYHKNRINDRDKKTVIKAMLIMEKRKIIENYDFINCKVNDKELVCIGKVKPTPNSTEYTFKIVYNLTTPKVYILNPIIEFNNDIHMYPQDNSLCLYHPKIDKIPIWNFKEHRLYDTIIPWTVEWFTYYELYLITGKWEHPEVKHTTSEKN